MLTSHQTAARTHLDAALTHTSHDVPTWQTLLEWCVMHDVEEIPAVVTRMCAALSSQPHVIATLLCHVALHLHRSHHATASTYYTRSLSIHATCHTHVCYGTWLRTQQRWGEADEQYHAALLLCRKEDVKMWAMVRPEECDDVTLRHHTRI